MNLKLQDVSRTVGETSPFSHFAEYKREREGKLVLEQPEGFAVYQLTDKFVYIEDIYVTKEARKTGLATIMANQICEEAKALGLTVLVGSVDIRARGATESMKVLLAYGMKLDSIDNSLIYLRKQI